MLILAFNTLGNNLSIALMQDDQILQDFCDYSQSKHSELLIPEIQKIFIKQKISYSDLDLVATTITPGSFTACRIAQIVAKSFKISLEIPVFMLDSCDVLADKICKKYDFSGEFVIGFDGSMSEYYFAKYSNINKNAKKINDSILIDLEILQKALLENNLKYFGTGKRQLIEAVNSSSFDKISDIFFGDIDEEVIAQDIAIYAQNQLRFGNDTGLDGVRYLRQPRIEKRKK